MSTANHPSPVTPADVAQCMARSPLLPYAVLDEAGDVRLASPALRDLLGVTDPFQSLEGGSFLSWVLEEDRHALDAFRRAATRSNQRSEHQCRLTLQSGLEIPVLAAGCALGQEGLTLLVFTDLSSWVDLGSGDWNSGLSTAHDAGTGLPQRALLDDRMQVAFAAARRYRRKCAVLSVDIHNFAGALLDQPGRATELQAALAETLRNCVRDSDTVARLGTQHFAVLLFEIGNHDDAGVMAARLVQAVDALARREPTLSLLCAHVGVALFPTDGASPSRLLQVADEALASARSLPTGGFAIADATRTELVNFEELLFRDEYLVGIEAIDIDHRFLVERTNDLVRRLRSGEDPLHLRSAIESVIEFLGGHFETESQLLDSSPYSGAIDQKSRDLRFLDELRCILLQVNPQSVALAVRHLYDWLVPHFVTTESRHLLGGDAQDKHDRVGSALPA